MYSKYTKRDLIDLFKKTHLDVEKIQIQGQYDGLKNLIEDHPSFPTLISFFKKINNSVDIEEDLKNEIRLELEDMPFVENSHPLNNYEDKMVAEGYDLVFKHTNPFLLKSMI